MKTSPEPPSGCLGSLLAERIQVPGAWDALEFVLAAICDFPGAPIWRPSFSAC